MLTGDLDHVRDDADSVGGHGVIGLEADLRVLPRFIIGPLNEEITGQRRNRIYRYSPYLELFAGDTAELGPAED